SPQETANKKDETTDFKDVSSQLKTDLEGKFPAFLHQGNADPECDLTPHGKARAENPDQNFASELLPRELIETKNLVQPVQPRREDASRPSIAGFRTEKFSPEEGQQKHLLPSHDEEKKKERRVYMTTGFSLLPFLTQILPEDIIIVADWDPT
ncbi:unnamed protein product, partial [Amoebophrya sp. A25]